MYTAVPYYTLILTVIIVVYRAQDKKEHHTAQFLPGMIFPSRIPNRFPSRFPPTPKGGEAHHTHAHKENGGLVAAWLRGTAVNV